MLESKRPDESSRCDDAEAGDLSSIVDLASDSVVFTWITVSHGFTTGNGSLVSVNYTVNFTSSR